MKNIRKLIIALTFVVMAMVVMTAVSFADTTVTADGVNYSFTDSTNGLWGIATKYVSVPAVEDDITFSTTEYSTINGITTGTQYNIPAGKSAIFAEDVTTYLSQDAFYTEIGFSAGDTAYGLCDSGFSQLYIIVVKAISDPEMTEDGFYKIANAAQLSWFSDKVNAGEYSIKARLMNDIDMTDITSWTPIGSASSRAFSGIFDGNGKAITNFNISFSGTGRGLFGYNKGVIKALTIEQSAITFNGSYSGAFVGQNLSGGFVYECINMSSLSLWSNASGGIVGINSGYIIKCGNMGVVNAYMSNSSYSIGGIAGINSGLIDSCYNSGDTSFNNSSGRLGGLVGTLTGSGDGAHSIKNSYFSGVLSVPYSSATRYAAKLIHTIESPNAGVNQLVQNCYADITKDDYSFRLVYSDLSGGAVKDCLNAETILASDLGTAFTDDTDNINAGYPILLFQKTGEYTEPESTDGMEIVEIVSFDGKHASLKMNKALEYLSPSPADFTITYRKQGEEPVSTAIQMLSMEGDTAMLTIAGIPESELGTEEEEYIFNFSYKGGEEKTCTHKAQARYWSAYAEEPEKITKGDRTWPEYAGYYKITKAEELAWFALLVNGDLEEVEQNQKAMAFLADDIVLNDTEDWEEWDEDTMDTRFWDCTIGKAQTYNASGQDEIRFEGIFDGNYHTVKGLYTYQDPVVPNYKNIQYVALFPSTYRAKIMNLGVEQSFISTTSNSAASGIVGFARETEVKNCWFKGHAKGNGTTSTTAAGIVGQPYDADIRSCFNAGRIESTGDASGIAAARAGIVYDCYNTGNITAGGAAYGMIGYADSMIYSCYSTDSSKLANVNAKITNSFYLDTAPDLGNQGAAMLTDEKFKDGTLLTGLSSDAFCADDPGEAAKNDGYPILVWQSDLFQAKRAAVKEVRYYLDADKYVLSQNELDEVIEQAVQAIESAEDADSVAAAKDAAIAAFAEFKEDADVEAANTDAVNRLKEEIAKIQAAIEFHGATVKAAKASVVYNGKAQKPAVTVTGKSGGVLVEGVDYTVEYKANTKPGIATIVVTSTGEAAEEKTAAFKILPKKAVLSKVTPAKKSLTVTWKKDAVVTGYEVQYSLKKNFKGAKTVKITKAGTTKKVIKSLKTGKKYFVKVRSYKKAGKKMLYGAWSKAKNAKVK